VKLPPTDAGLDSEPSATVLAYLHEILRRARTAQNQCAVTEDLEFSSDSPRRLVRTLRVLFETAEGLASRVVARIRWSKVKTLDDVLDDLSVLRTIDYFVQQLLSHLRYVESTQTHRLPWSIVASFEKLAAGILDNRVSIMLRPQWHYNYATHTQDLGSLYKNQLRLFKPGLTRGYDPDVLLRELEHPLHLISFPVLERTNVFAHPLLGHEIGHLLVADFVESRRDSFWKRALPEVQALGGKDSIRNDADWVLDCWRQTIEEVLCDAVAAFVYGPAAIFAFAAMGMIDGLDASPLEKGLYPPWRFRLRSVLDLVADYFPVRGDLFAATKLRGAEARLNRRFEQLRQIASSTNDRPIIESHPLLKVVYDLAPEDLSAGKIFLRRKSGISRNMLNPNALYGTLPQLLSRLESGIPPNAVGTPFNGESPATLPVIINAAWYYSIGCGYDLLVDEDSRNEAARLRRRLDTLTLKAIEYGDIALEYEKNGPGWDPSRRRRRQGTQRRRVWQ
jgi:hypothetical protein